MFFFSSHLNFIFRQFKTAEDVPAPYKSDTKVLVGIVTIIYFSNINTSTSGNTFSIQLPTFSCSKLIHLFPL